MKFNECIDYLSKQLLMELPGELAQFRMAPSKRKSTIEKYLDSKNIRNSSVLLLLYPCENVTNIIFIRRAIDNGHHSGQIALPGGTYELSDNDLITTALRETEEEIGVSANDIKIIGSLTKLFIPVSNYWVHPFVGSINKVPLFNPDKREVDEILPVSLNHFTNKKVVKVHNFNTISGVKITAPYYDLENDKLWGATAMIVSEFLDVLKLNQ